MSDPTPYELFGAADGVRALVDRFYDLMDLEPQAAAIRALHPPVLDGSRDKLFLYLSGWLGGPQTYTETRGHPRMRARHLPFPIGPAERDAWLACMHQAVAETLPAGPPRDRFIEALDALADHLRNRD